jgi:hypothetical protein
MPGGLRLTGVAAQAAGVVDQHMEHSEGVDGGPQTVCAGFQIGDVGLDGERPARAGDGGDLIHQRVETVQHTCTIFRVTRS